MSFGSLSTQLIRFLTGTSAASVERVDRDGIFIGIPVRERVVTVRSRVESLLRANGGTLLPAEVGLLLADVTNDRDPEGLLRGLCALEDRLRGQDQPEDDGEGCRYGG